MDIVRALHCSAVDASGCQTMFLEKYTFCTSSSSTRDLDAITSAAVGKDGVGENLKKEAIALLYLVRHRPLQAVLS